MAKRRTKKWLICETLGCSQQRQGHIVPKPTDAVRLVAQRDVILSEIQHVVRGSLYRAAGSGERRTLGSDFRRLEMLYRKFVGTFQLGPIRTHLFAFFSISQ